MYRVRDRRLQRQLALKTIRPSRMLRESAISRFIEEAQISSQLQHPADRNKHAAKSIRLTPAVMCARSARSGVKLSPVDRPTMFPIRNRSWPWRWRATWGRAIDASMKATLRPRFDRSRPPVCKPTGKTGRDTPANWPGCWTNNSLDARVGGSGQSSADSCTTLAGIDAVLQRPPGWDCNRLHRRVCRSDKNSKPPILSGNSIFRLLDLTLIRLRPDCRSSRTVKFL